MHVCVCEQYIRMWPRIEMIIIYRRSSPPPTHPTTSPLLPPSLPGARPRQKKCDHLIYLTENNYGHTQMRARSLTSHTPAPACVHTQTHHGYTHLRARTHIHTHTHTHTHARTLARAHTHVRPRYAWTYKCFKLKCIFHQKF